MELNKSLALELIEENKRTKNPFLDLGNCGLTDHSQELELLRDCIHLEGINLGRYYYIDEKPVFSKNTEPYNYFNGVPLNLPKNIKKLYINLVSLERLDGINHYQNLEFVDAFGNILTSLSFLQKNTNLVSLGLSNNGVRFLNGIEQFPNLKYLYLGQNDISIIEANFLPQLSKLTTLYLYKNWIKDINFLKGNTSLRHLYLNQNQIKNIDLLIDLIYIETLDINDNTLINKIPKDIIVSKSGVKIRWQLNSIFSLAEILIQENIKKQDPFLDLGDCGLTDFSTELDLLRNCSHLKILSLGRGYYLEDSTFRSSQNNLSSNYFTIAPPNLPRSLQVLQMRNCHLSSMANFNRLTNLRYLDLSFNQVKRITSIGSLDKLIELALHNNKILDLTAVQFPKQLQILYLDENRITDLNGIEQCLKLHSLYLSNNTISSIKPLINLPDLSTLTLENNPITDCPSDVWVSNDIKQIRAFYNNIAIIEKEFQKDVIRNEKKSKNIKKDAATSSIIPNDVKLIILGNSNTGKTHLVHFLETGTFLETRNSTHGLEVKRWKPDKKRFPQLQDIEVSIWDFGGQEYYHDAYKLFLGSDAVYVTMWCEESDCNEKKKEVIKEGESHWIDHYEKAYWLDTLHYFRGKSSSSPLLLVQNKVDDISAQKKRVSQELHDAYQISESFHISFKEGCDTKNTEHYKSLENFAQYLANTLVTVASKAQLPENCKRVRNEVLKLTTNQPSAFTSFVQNDQSFITKESFTTACEQYLKSDSESYSYYPNWLNRGGTLVYFDNNASLNNYVFINPKLLSEEIYSILNHEVIANQGAVAIASLQDKDPVIIQAMKSLELLYPHPVHPETHYIAPQYLPENHPIEDLFKIASVAAWQDSFWISVPMFYYKKLMHYLLLHYMCDTESSARYFWKNGIILLKNNRKILIKGLFPTDQKGFIQISVENCKESAELRRALFKTIIAFRIQGDSDFTMEDGSDNITLKKNRNELQSNFQDSLYLSKLELSVDKQHFISYTRLDALSKKTIRDASKENEFVQYQHLLTLDGMVVKPKNVFVSYSHKDAVWVGKIRSHLSGLRRSNYIKDWTDQEILAGEQWDLKIKEQMDKADIFVLLLSADFIASDYIWNVELNSIFSRNDNPTMKIIPIYIEPCDFMFLPAINGKQLKDFEIIPKDGNEQLKPLSLWGNEAEGLAKVAERIRVAVMEKTAVGLF